MFSRFFIDRPIFASVISIIIVFAGGIALSTLPIAQYPEIVPPVVQVRASYPGADPQVIAETVAAPIEQQVNGVENMLYMSSQSSADGLYNLNVTFELGTDVDINTVLTQNRVAAALAQLPEEVRPQRHLCGLAEFQQLQAVLHGEAHRFHRNDRTLAVHQPCHRVRLVLLVEIHSLFEYRFPGDA